MKFKLFFLFMFVVFVFCSGNAGAEIIPGTFTLGINQGIYLFEEDQDLDNTTPMGLGFGYDFTEHFGLEYYYHWGETKTESARNDVDFEFYRIEALGYYGTWKGIIPYFALGMGSLNLEQPGKKIGETVVDFGIGMKYFVTDHVAFRADVRNVLPMPRNNPFLTVGFTYHFGERKKEAPVVRAPVYVPEPEPAPPADSDGDGVYDDEDQCPNTPYGIRVDSKGCPLDSDGDGVTDDRDDCPNTPPGTRVDTWGCPIPVDSDGDGVYDDEDECPNTPYGTRVDAWGCPVPMDSDRDGVYDDEDQCPDTPDGATVDSRGCWVLSDLKFDTNKADIKAEGARILDSVVSIMRANPGLRLEVQGHTDNTGSAAYNKGLSQRRANAVMEYLVAEGIDKARLSAVGYGFDRPATSNETEEGRAQNRRVELNPIQ